jgi:hypothetical protein
LEVKPQNNDKVLYEQQKKQDQSRQKLEELAVKAAMVGTMIGAFALGK